MAQPNKFYTFLIMCTGMAAGSTAVNRVSGIIYIYIHYYFLMY